MRGKVRAHLFIKGLVQGVFFRKKTKEMAETLGLKGWVRNIFGERVEAVFEGEKERIEKMIEWAKKGPPLARVDDLDVKWEEYKGEFENFEIRYD